MADELPTAELRRVYLKRLSKARRACGVDVRLGHLRQAVYWADKVGKLEKLLDGLPRKRTL